MNRLCKRLIVVSLDAVGETDFPFLCSLPTFKQLMTDGVYCANVTGVYPSLTYPAHTSIVTGCYPSRHGVVNNILFQPHRKKADWFWKKKHIKTPTFYDEAIDRGMTVASLLWPVTGGSRIQYNLPEIWPNRVYQNQVVVSLLNGTPGYLLQLNKRFGHIRDGTVQPQLDDFTFNSLLYTLKRHRPDVTMVHFIDADDNKHRFGANSAEAREAIVRHDKRLGGMLKLLKDENMLDGTAIIVLGDHSQLDVHTVIYPNAAFRKEGLLEVQRRNGSIYNWEAVASHCDGSCYVYIKNPAKNKQRVQKLLSELQTQTGGIERILTSQEASAKGADPSCCFMLEARDGFYFLDEADRNGLTSPTDVRAAHGFLPEKPGYKTIFIAKGAGILKSGAINQMCIIDYAPTFARLLGFEMKGTDGKVLSMTDA